MYTSRKKIKEKKVCIPCSSTFLRKLIETKHFFSSSETVLCVYITTCQNTIYKSYKKNYNKSCNPVCPLVFCNQFKHITVY